MGFFSWKCSYCLQSIKACGTVIEEHKWQERCVLLPADGCVSVVSGLYNGYGCIDLGDGIEFDIDEECVDEEESEIMHYECWSLDGRRSTPRGPMFSAEDQGYFYNPDDLTGPVPQRY